MDNSTSSDILWSAQIAQQKTKEILKNYANGGFSIMYIGDLSDGIANKLRSLGYDIFDRSIYSPAYEISWE